MIYAPLICGRIARKSSCAIVTPLARHDPPPLRSDPNLFRDCDPRDFVVQKQRMLKAVQRHDSHQHRQLERLPGDLVIARAENFRLMWLKQGLTECEICPGSDFLLQHIDFFVEFQRAHIERAPNRKPRWRSDAVPGSDRRRCSFFLWSA